MLSITPQQALADYLALGAGRSIQRLYKRYIEDMQNGAPAEITLRTWSSKYGWVKAAKRHDERVAERLVGRLEDADLARAFDRVEALRAVAQSCLEDAVKIRVGEKATVSDKRQLVAAAVEAIKTVEVLTGGVSDRTETTDKHAAEAMELLHRLAAEKRATGRLTMPTSVTAPMIDVTPRQPEAEPARLPMQQLSASADAAEPRPRGSTRLGIPRATHLRELAGQSLRLWCHPCGQERTIPVDGLIRRLGSGHPVSQLGRHLSCPAPHCQSRNVELRLDFHEAADVANAIPEEED